MTTSTFREYLESLSAVAPQATAADPEALDDCVHATAVITSLNPLDRENLAFAVKSDPHLLPVLAAAVGLSQERFKSWLQSHFETAGWVMLGRERPEDLVAAMDEDLNLVELLSEQSEREWTWADVLARAMAPRQRAGSAIKQGRNLEDEVESVIEAIGLNFEARTRFMGVGQDTAPADFAVPAGEQDALITIAVKGFDSTGSKLGDARREIEEMAKVRKPTQFIFAVVDGQGWLRRQNDLRRIHALWVEGRIDGLFNRASLPDLKREILAAARRVALTE